MCFQPLGLAEAKALVALSKSLEETWAGAYSEPDGEGGWRVVITPARIREAKDKLIELGEPT